MHPETKLVLQKALKLIQHGWIKARMKGYDKKGRLCYCALGAIKEASELTSAYFPEYIENQAVSFLRDYTGIKHEYRMSVWVWNDHKRTTKADVVRAFDRAIAACPLTPRSTCPNRRSIGAPVRWTGRTRI